MNAQKLIIIYVEFMLIVAVTMTRFLTFNGSCPSVNLKPSLTNVVPLNTTEVTVIALSVPINGLNFTDYNAIWEQTGVEEVTISCTLRSKETCQCSQFLYYLEHMDPSTGAYDTLYQVADSSFEKFKTYFLLFDPSTFTIIAFICRNLTNSQYQASLILLSEVPSTYDETAQEKVKTVLENNNLEFLNQYIVAIEHHNKC